MSEGEQIVNAYFEPADNQWVELDQNNTSRKVEFGVESRICAVSVSHGNSDYVIVKLRKPEDTKPFWKHKYMPRLDGQIFIQPIPKQPMKEVIVEVEPKQDTQISDKIFVNITYI